MSRDNSGSFKVGHEKIGGFSVGSCHTIKSKRKISQSLVGLKGAKSRRWKGDSASYQAKHIWIVKNFGKALLCSFNNLHTAKRFEWANLSLCHKRDRFDYIQLCPSCHRKFDACRLHEKIN